ncbi:MAG: COX15/CtaA family protein [Geodermatophilaceae bacterium]|nr:COX15/CtaA family protein [Geodermatophilaceae bacterium]
MSGLWVRRLAFVSVVVNVGIVVTGGAVRLTASGLGCPTVPYCTEDSFVPTAELGGHGVIEFTNRTLTSVIGLVALATLVAVWRDRPRRRDLLGPAIALLVGIPAQALLGAVTVLTELNPWTVMGHFLLSMLLIAAAVVLWVRSNEAPGGTAAVVPAPLRLLTRGLLAVLAAVLLLGTVVTGTGPHAGDPDSPRMGFDLAVVSQLHADGVLLLVGLTIALWAGLLAVRAPQRVLRAAVALISVEFAQGLIGFVQYFTDLPVLLVGFHLLGAGLVNVFAVRLYLSMRVRLPLAEAGVTGAESAGELRPELLR